MGRREDSLTGVVLYGPPAAGKDTITRALSTLDSRYELFRRGKCGPGRATGYRMINDAELRALRATGRVVWENTRYGATYIVNRSALMSAATKVIPVLHLGQVEAVTRVTAAMPEIRWVVVELWCSRASAAERIQARGGRDVLARLAVYDQTSRLPDSLTDLRLTTDKLAPEQAATRIRLEVTSTRGASPDA